MKKVVFIISLPRSGSTLLQRLLGTHSKINVISEPWILIPHYQIDKLGLDAYYDGYECRTGIKSFFSNLPNHKQQYLKEISKSINNLYLSMLNDNEEILIDKTPRYYNFIEEIHNNFTDAKFIFLFRDPLSIYNSIINSWCNGKYIKKKQLFRDINDGPKMIADGYNKLRGSERIHLINYSDLVNDVNNSLLKIYNFLEINDEVKNICLFKNIDLGNGLGDNIGIKKFKNVSNESDKRWKKDISTLSRKLIFKNYILKIPDSYFECLGTSREVILKELNELKTKKIGIYDWFDYQISNFLKNYFFQQSIKNEFLFRFRNPD